MEERVMKRHFKALLVEDNPQDVDLIQEMLVAVDGYAFDLERVARLSEGLKRLDEGDFDLVLLDLQLPDSKGFDTFTTTQNHVPHLPIIVLTGVDDKALAVRAVRDGAQDYLVKSKVDGELLGRAMRYAVERKRVERDLRRRTAQLEALREVALAITSELDLEEVLDTIAARATALSHSDAGAVFELDGR